VVHLHLLLLLKPEAFLRSNYNMQHALHLTRSCCMAPCGSQQQLQHLFLLHNSSTAELTTCTTGSNCCNSAAPWPHLQVKLLQEAQARQALQQLAQVAQLVVAQVQVSEELEAQQAALERADGVVLQEAKWHAG
jgi:hypothetical protein